MEDAAEAYERCENVSGVVRCTRARILVLMCLTLPVC